MRVCASWDLHHIYTEWYERIPSPPELLGIGETQPALHCIARVPFKNTPSDPFQESDEIIQNSNRGHSLTEASVTRGYLMKGVYTGSAADGQSRGRRLVMRQCRDSVNEAVYCQSEAKHRAIEPLSRFHWVVRE